MGSDGEKDDEEQPEEVTMSSIQNVQSARDGRITTTRRMRITCDSAGVEGPATPDDSGNNNFRKQSTLSELLNAQLRIQE